MAVYNVYVFGGSIGEISADKNKRMFISGMGEGRLYGTFETKEEAKKAGLRYVKSFGGGRRSYYKPKYRVIKVSNAELWGHGSGWGEPYNYR